MKNLSLAFAMLAAGIVGGTALCGCGDKACTNQALPALSVRVLDGPGGGPICDATVTAQDGMFSAVLPALASSPCSYYGPTERTGTYSVTAASGARTMTVDNIQVANDACNIVTQNVAMTLPATN